MENKREEILNNVKLQFVNTASYGDCLNNYPNRPWNDLSIVYTIKANSFEEISQRLIMNELMVKAGLTEEMLYEAAYKNTKELFPSEFMSIKKVLEGMLKDFYTEIEDEIPEESDIMQVLTTEKSRYGAAILLYPELIDRVARKLDDNLYLIPSSIHEVLAVPAEFSSLAEIALMVSEVNNTQVAPNERLSNSVYYYDGCNKKVKLAYLSSDPI